MHPIIFAILAAISFGLWTVFHKLASQYINQVFGAILVSLTAATFGGVVFYFRARGVELVSDAKGLIFIVLAGIAAFLLDLLALLAYSRGISLSVGGPIIIGGSMAVAVMAGFVLGDIITSVKMVGILLILAGAVVLSIFG